MAFQLRSRSTIIASMLSDIRAMGAPMTDFTVGSITRSLTEAVGTEISALEQGSFEAVNEAIDTGTWKNFQFAQQPARSAIGKVTFSFSTAVVGQQVIPAGTRVGIPGTSTVYASMNAVVVPNGAMAVLVPIVCQVAGTVGNTAAGTITNLIDALGFASATITNTAPITNGQPIETDTARFNRFQNFIAGLSAGTTFALQSAAESVALYNPDGTIMEGVQSASVIEGFATNPDAPLTVVQIYIDNGGGFASATLIEAVTKVINGYVNQYNTKKSGISVAGMITTVLPVITETVGVNMIITGSSGYDPETLATTVANAVLQYISSLDSGDSYVVGEAIAAALSVAGTTDARPIAPSSNVIPPPGRRIVAGPVVIQDGLTIVTL